MSDQAQYVTVVNPNDVLFGRGSGPNDHEGNIKFRDLVASRKGEYMATNHRQTKANIAKDIVNTVFNAQGRFLKKIEAAELQKMGLPTTTEVYQIVDDDTVMEKAKQALRQNREKREDGKKSPKRAQQRQTPQQQQQQAIKLQEIAVPNYPASLGSHDALDPLPVPSVVNQANADHAPTPRNPEYATYTAQLEDLVSQDRAVGQVGRRGSRSNNGRRDSLQLEDLIGNAGMNEMMESFKGMSATGDGHDSTDTIGTIDNMFGAESQHMSGISNMSISSVFKNKDNKSKDSLKSHRNSSGDMMSIRSRNLSGSKNTSWAQSPQSGLGGNAAWGESNQSMQPPPPRPMTSEQIAAALMVDPLQDSSQAFAMSTSGFSTGISTGFSTGSLMMTSMDSLPEDTEANGQPKRILPR